jgi:hypothetical protein
VTLVDMNTLKVTKPALSTGKYGIVITNPDGETYSLDGCLTINRFRLLDENRHLHLASGLCSARL